MRSYNRPTWFQEISLYFYEVTQTRMPPYFFECMIALVKADDFTTNIQSSNLKQHFCFSAGGYCTFYSQLILCTQTGFCSLRTSGLYNITIIYIITFTFLSFDTVLLKPSLECANTNKNRGMTFLYQS